MDRLHEINYLAIANELDEIKTVVGENVRCDDLINIVSSSVESDKRLISDFTELEVYTDFIEVKNVLRKCRIFTPAGIKRYILEGKISGYQYVCRYYSIDAEDKVLKQLNSYLSNGYFTTSKILKWLFQKRKRFRRFDKLVSVEDLVEWVNEYEMDDMVNKDVFLKYYEN